MAGALFKFLYSQSLLKTLLFVFSSDPASSDKGYFYYRNQKARGKGGTESYVCRQCQLLSKSGPKHSCNYVSMKQGELTARSDPDKGHHPDCKPLTMNEVFRQQAKLRLFQIVEETGKTAVEAHTEFLMRLPQLARESGADYEPAKMDNCDPARTDRTCRRRKSAKNPQVKNPKEIPEIYNVTMRGREGELGADAFRGERWKLFQSDDSEPNVLLFMSDVELRALLKTRKSVRFHNPTAATPAADVVSDPNHHDVVVSFRSSGRGEDILPLQQQWTGLQEQHGSLREGGSDRKRERSRSPRRSRSPEDRKRKRSRSPSRSHKRRGPKTPPNSPPPDPKAQQQTTENGQATKSESGTTLSANTMPELEQVLSPCWTGALVLKKSAYAIRLHKLTGDDDLIDSKLRDPGSGESVKLNVTQRLPFAVGAAAGGLADRFGQTPKDQLAFLLAMANPNASGDLRLADSPARPLKALIHYLGEKQAAGVVSLNGGSVLYAFPHCELADTLLAKVAPSIAVLKNCKENCLLVILSRSATTVKAEK